MTPSFEEQKALTVEERAALAEFARLEIPISQLVSRLAGRLEVDFCPPKRRVTTHFLLPQPGIRIGKEDIQRALDKQWRGELTDSDLADWAAMLMLNEAYDWQGPDEDEIADLLNELSMTNPNPEAE